MNNTRFSLWLFVTCAIFSTHLQAVSTQQESINTPISSKNIPTKKIIMGTLITLGALAIGGGLYYLIQKYTQIPPLTTEQQEIFDYDFAISLQAHCSLDAFDEILQENPGANLQQVLYSAINWKRLDVVQKLLIEYEANPNFHITRSGPDHGQTPLIRAVKTDAPEFHKIAQLLFDHGAKIDDCDRSNMTALHFAASTGNTTAITILKKAGAPLNAKDINDWTPLRWAQDYGQREAGKLLISYGATL